MCHLSKSFVLFFCSFFHSSGVFHWWNFPYIPGFLCSWEQRQVDDFLLSVCVSRVMGRSHPVSGGPQAPVPTALWGGMDGTPHPVPLRTTAEQVITTLCCDSLTCERVNLICKTEILPGYEQYCHGCSSLLVFSLNAPASNKATVTISKHFHFKLPVLN